MENVTIVNFPKNQITAQVVKKGNEVSVGSKAGIYTQLEGYAYNKEFGLDVKKLSRKDNSDSYSFVMQNKGNQIVVNFEDKEDPYYENFHSIYLSKKIEEKFKDQKIQKFKTFGKTAVATVLVAASVVGYGTWLHKRDARIKEVMDEQSRIITESNHTIDAKSAYDMALENLGITQDNQDSPSKGM